jgi:LuxR family maltose regulon positive regulatory protein
LALARGIEAPFARELVQRRRLPPPTFAVAHWPWALRIHTLGEFALEVDGTPLAFEGKAPKKPLALLKALIALGPNPVPERTLADVLWPDYEADAARDALHVALHRLRKLVPHGADLFPVQEGRIGIAANDVWIDCRAFEQRVATADRASESGAPPLQPLNDALALYRGPFLVADADAPWTISARERLRARFSRVVIGCGRALADAGRDEEALDCYRRGLEADDLDEAFYQGVMRCALRLRRPAEGLAAYQRLRRVLALQLGVAPSAGTEALARQLIRS